MFTPATPRPTKKSPEVIATAAQNLAPAVIGWLRSHDEDADLATVVSELTEALTYHTDGYDLACELEWSRVYAPDAQLVAVLETAGDILCTAVKNACRAWVTTLGLTPVPSGARVTDNIKAHGVGTVLRTYAEGTAVVSFPQLGHTEKSGLVVPWENLTVEP